MPGLHLTVRLLNYYHHDTRAGAQAGAKDAMSRRIDHEKRNRQDKQMAPADEKLDNLPTFLEKLVDLERQVMQARGKGPNPHERNRPANPPRSRLRTKRN